MGLELAGLRVGRPAADVAAAGWDEYLAQLHRDGVPAGLLAGVEARAHPFHAVLGRLDGEPVAAGLAFDLDGDCGIYNVSTLEAARRRGIGTAVTARLALDARDRGCATASLQATAASERLYAAIGFRDLGRFFEYTPAATPARPSVRSPRSPAPRR